MAFAFDGHFHDELCAAGDGLESHQLEVTAYTAVDRHRRRKPNAIESIVDGHSYIADFERGSYHDGYQTEGQMAMSHWGAEGPGGCAHRIDMNPLVIAGDGRKMIDERLIDGLPVAGSQSGPHERLQFR